MADNQYKAAFGESANLLGLAALAAVSAASLNPVPILAGLVLEAGYLLFVSDSAWYRDRLRRRADAEAARAREMKRSRLLPTLSFVSQERFARLESVRKQIEGQAVDDHEWMHEVLRKLDYLLDQFLVFAAKQGEFARYVQTVIGGVDVQRAPAIPTMPGAGSAGIRSSRRSRNQREGPQNAPEPQTDPSLFVSDEAVQLAVAEVRDRYDREIDALKKEMEQEKDESTRAVIQKRGDVLERRREYVGRIGSILSNLNHQLGLVEDTFGLISDEIRARSPEQILADIEDVVFQTESMTQVLDELAPYEQMAARLSL